MIIRVRQEGLNLLLSSWGGREGRIRDLSRPFFALAELLEQDFARQFEAEGTPRWKPLAPSTRRQRRRLGFPPAHPILRRTGALMRSWTDGREHYRRVSPRRLVIGSRSDYAVYHQSLKPRRKLPRRAVHALRKPVLAEFWRYLTNWVKYGDVRGEAF